MGVYRRLIIPPLLDLVMRRDELTARGAALVPRARGRVLEVGIGSGLNLPFYGSEVTAVSGLDPSPELLRQAREQGKAVAFPVQLVRGSAEDIPLESGSVDTAVITWTLCSIARPGRALQEVRRVLEPAGRLLFVEHGLSPEPAVARWQHRLEPVWRRLSGGCHLTRKTDELIEAAGFELMDTRAWYLPGPRLLGWAAFTYQGEARLAPAGSTPLLRGSASPHR